MKRLIKIFFLVVLCTLTLVAQPTTGLLYNNSFAYDGYTLFAPVASNFTYLINNCGEVVNKWEGSKPPAYTVYLLEDGSLLRVSNGLLEHFSWSGDLIWYVDIGVDLQIRNHHDIEPLPNGNILVIAGEYFSIAEAIEKGRNPQTLDNQVSVDYIVELEPVENNKAKIVWEWHFWDHLIQDFDSLKQNYGELIKNPQLLDINRGEKMDDWVHVNSIDYNSDLDQILISSPYANELYIIDHSTTSEEAATNIGGKYGKGGDFLWRWGNPKNYKAGIESDRKLFGQHDAKWIPASYPNQGSISVFNNNFKAQSSAVHIIQLPNSFSGNYTLQENRFLPNDFLWTYNDEVLGDDFFNTIKSGMQVQPNGNILVSLGSGLLFEITEKEQLVWAYQNPVIDDENISSQFYDVDKAEIFRAERYPANYEAFNNKDLSSKGTIEDENPLTLECKLATSFTGLVDKPENHIHYQQVNNLLIITSLQYDINVEIIDIFGRLKLQTTNSRIDISHLPAGLYVALINQKKISSYHFVKI